MKFEKLIIPIVVLWVFFPLLYFGCSNKENPNKENLSIKSEYNYSYFMIRKFIKDIYSFYKTDKHSSEVNLVFSVDGFDVNNEKFCFWGRIDDTSMDYFNFIVFTDDFVRGKIFYLSKDLDIEYIKLNYPLLFIFYEKEENKFYFSIVNIEEIKNGSQVSIEGNLLPFESAIFTDFQWDFQANLFLGAYVFINEDDSNKGPRFAIVKITKEGKIDKNFGNNGILLFKHSNDTSVSNGGRFFIKDGLFYGYAISYPDAYIFTVDSNGKVDYLTLTQKEGLDLFNLPWNYFIVNSKRNFFLFVFEENIKILKIIPKIKQKVINNLVCDVKEEYLNILNTFIDEKDRIYLVLEENQEGIHIFQISDNKQGRVFELTTPRNFEVGVSPREPVKMDGSKIYFLLHQCQLRNQETINLKTFLFIVEIF